ALVVELVAPDRLERLPAPAFETLLGVTLPCVRLDAAAPSAVTKVRLALDLALGRILRGDD
ncbi:MAG: aldolase, partial [Rhodospirillaceae bacterium]